MTTNGYEDAARQRKANALADMLDAFNVTPETAEALTVIERLDVATAAGQKMPSEQTWTMAVDLLRHRLDVRASLADTDPLAGFPKWAPE